MIINMNDWHPMWELPRSRGLKEGAAEQLESKHRENQATGTKVRPIIGATNTAWKIPPSTIHDKKHRN
jgi:hypothetical protein